MTVMSESLPVTQKILKWVGRGGFSSFQSQFAYLPTYLPTYPFTALGWSEMSVSTSCYFCKKLFCRQLIHRILQYNTVWFLSESKLNRL